MGCAELKEGLASQGVTDVKRVMRTDKDGKKVETNTLFLTFCTATMPTRIVVLYESIPVAPFVPSPLRCFKCQKFGHSSKNCKGKDMCRDCTKEKHESNCDGPKQCHNCNGPHSSSSRECPQWKTEEKIQKVRSETKCSFGEAKQKVMYNPSATQPVPAGFEGFLSKVTDLIDHLIQKVDRLENVVVALSKCLGKTAVNADGVDKLPPVAQKTSEKAASPDVSDRQAAVRNTATTSTQVGVKNTTTAPSKLDKWKNATNSTRRLDTKPASQLRPVRSNSVEEKSRSSFKGRNIPNSRGKKGDDSILTLTNHYSSLSDEGEESAMEDINPVCPPPVESGGLEME
ncbi:hypothetical protein V1264_004226 [Littorina saxatilis]|uniref:CCHC-type domain-containing protein n=1 Tax=Littorina saxatilis TaxID=31220 RepID=A0AAN9B153_9CAEN